MASQQKIILLAASGLAREVMAALEHSRTGAVVGMLDDNPALHGQVINGVHVLGGIAAAVDHPEAHFVACVGNGNGRRQIADRLADLEIASDRMATVIHPTASVPATCVVGRGSVLLSHSVLTADVIIGENVVVMPHVVLTHDDQVGDFATLCAGVVLGGNVRVGVGAYLGMNSSVRQNLEIGDAATLGMGSVLIQDLPAGQTWAGVPAAQLTGSRGGMQRQANPARLDTTAIPCIQKEMRTG